MLLCVGKTRHHVVKAMRKIYDLRRALLFHARAVITAPNGPKCGRHFLQERERPSERDINQQKHESAEQRQDNECDLKIAPGFIDLVMRSVDRKIDP